MLKIYVWHDPRRGPYRPQMVPRMVVWANKRLKRLKPKRKPGQCWKH